MATAPKIDTTPLLKKPDWQEWRNRPHCTLWEGLYLAHDIFTSKRVLEKLQEKKDIRVSQYLAHRNTAIKAIRANTSDLPYLHPRPKLIDSTKLFLPDFIAWVEKQNWQNLPIEFINLKKIHEKKVPIPDWNIWRDRPILKIREAISLFLNIDPDIHLETLGRLTYRSTFKELDRKEETVLRMLNFNREKYNISIDSNEIVDHNTPIRADSFCVFLANMDWPISEDLKNLSARAAMRLPNIMSPSKTESPMAMATINGKIVPQSMEQKNDILLAAITLMFSNSIVRQKKTGASNLTNKIFKASGQFNHNALGESIESFLKNNLKDPEQDLKNQADTIKRKLAHGFSYFKDETLKNIQDEDKLD